jgi:3-deoxy-manno-octulosonate cytidylyltransferase (CMP-KDO synthetase)
MISGKPMIQRVYERVMACKRLNRVIVATDDQRIYERVEAFGGEVMMTDKSHLSGTDRCAEVSKLFPAFDIVINIQGDEPTIHPQSLESLIDLFSSNEEVEIVTLKYPLYSEEQISDPDVVKLVCDRHNRCLYFSRAKIPFQRNQVKPNYFKHIGVYGFRRDVLWTLTELTASKLELSERLEQLRWLENGYSIYATESMEDSYGVDNPEDLEKLNKLWTFK